VYQKDQRRRSVWVGQADFSKIAQRKQNSLNMSTACFLVLRKLMQQNMSSLFSKAFYQCLFKNLALSCGFMCDGKTNPPKKTADIFGSCGLTKTQIRSSAALPLTPPPHPDTNLNLKKSNYTWKGGTLLSSNSE